MINKILNKFVRAILIIPIIILALGTVQAANFSIFPSGGSHYSNFTASVYVKSPIQSVNAYSGTISFAKDKLRVVAISFNGSIVNFWAQQPSFSNEAGTISFEGVTFNPGFIGGLGKIFDITFAVNGLGAAPVLFAQGQILANDGAGTNVATAAENASYVIVVAPPAPPKSVVKSPAVPPKPVVSAGKPSTPVVTQSAVSNNGQTLTMSGTADEGNTVVVFMESEVDYNSPTCDIISPEGVVREEVNASESARLRIFLLSCGSLMELTPESYDVTSGSFNFDLREDEFEGKYNLWVKSMSGALVYSPSTDIMTVNFEPKPVVIGLTEPIILLINLAFFAVLITISLTMMKINNIKIVSVRRAFKDSWNKLLKK